MKGSAGTGVLALAGPILLAVAAMLAATAPAQGQAAPPEDLGARVARLIEEFAPDRDYSGPHAAAYRELVSIGAPAIPHIARALADPRTRVRQFCVEALGKIGGDATAPALITALKDEDANVRSYAVCFLGKLKAKSDAVIPALRQVLGDAEPAVVWYTIESLRQLGDDSYKKDARLVDALCAHLQSQIQEQRSCAAKALAAIGSSRACAPLVKAMAARGADKYTDNLSVMAMADALAQIGSREAAPGLLKILGDWNQRERICQAAAYALYHIGDPSLNERLLALTQDADARDPAVTALGFRDNAAAVPRLKEIAGDPALKAASRQAAADSLGRIGDAASLDALIVLVGNPEPRLRTSAARALGGIKSPKAVAALIAALDDEDAWFVINAANSLGLIGDRAAAPALVKLLDRKDVSGTMASNPSFASIPAAAQFALVRIIGDDPSGEKGIRRFTPESAAVWRKRLSLPDPAPKPQEPKPEK